MFSVLRKSKGENADTVKTGTMFAATTHLISTRDHHQGITPVAKTPYTSDPPQTLKNSHLIHFLFLLVQGFLVEVCCPMPSIISTLPWTSQPKIISRTNLSCENYQKLLIQMIPKVENSSLLTSGYGIGVPGYNIAASKTETTTSPVKEIQNSHLR
jgi:hypothetical protein